MFKRRDISLAGARAVDSPSSSSSRSWRRSELQRFHRSRTLPTMARRFRLRLAAAAASTTPPCATCQRGFTRTWTRSPCRLVTFTLAPSSIGTGWTTTTKIPSVVVSWAVPSDAGEEEEEEEEENRRASRSGSSLRRGASSCRSAAATISRARWGSIGPCPVGDDERTTATVFSTLLPDSSRRSAAERTTSAGCRPETGRSRAGDGTILVRLTRRSGSPLFRRVRDATRRTRERRFFFASYNSSCSSTLLVPAVAVLVFFFFHGC